MKKTILLFLSLLFLFCPLMQEKSYDFFDIEKQEFAQEESKKDLNDTDEKEFVLSAILAPNLIASKQRPTEIQNKFYFSITLSTPCLPPDA